MVNNFHIKPFINHHDKHATIHGRYLWHPLYAASAMNTEDTKSQVCGTGSCEPNQGTS